MAVLLGNRPPAPIRTSLRQEQRRFTRSNLDARFSAFDRLKPHYGSAPLQRCNSVCLAVNQAGRALAEAIAATISVLRPHHVILAGPGLQTFDMMRSAYEERLEQAVLPWLLKSTTIYVRPSESAAIVDGMVRRTLRVVDRNHMETTE